MKEIKQKSEILKKFSTALRLKNVIISDESKMNDMFNEYGILRERYSQAQVDTVLHEMEQKKQDYDKALGEFTDCFNVSLKDYVNFVSDVLKREYSVKTSLKVDNISNTLYSLYRLELKNDSSILNLKKKDSINIAVADKKYGVAKTNILNSSFALEDKKLIVPLMHFHSENSELLVNESKNQYSDDIYYNITKSFINNCYKSSDADKNIDL